MHPTRQIKPHLNRFVSIIIFKTETLLSRSKVIPKKFINEHSECKVLFGFEYMFILHHRQQYINKRQRHTINNPQGNDKNKLIHVIFAHSGPIIKLPFIKIPKVINNRLADK